MHCSERFCTPLTITATTVERSLHIDSHECSRAQGWRPESWARVVSVMCVSASWSPELPERAPRDSPAATCLPQFAAFARLGLPIPEPTCHFHKSDRIPVNTQQTFICCSPNLGKLSPRRLARSLINRLPLSIIA